MTSSRNFVFPLLDSTNLDLGMITIGVEGLGSRSAIFFLKDHFPSYFNQLHDEINYLTFGYYLFLLFFFFAASESSMNVEVVSGPLEATI